MRDRCLGFGPFFLRNDVTFSSFAYYKGIKV